MILRLASGSATPASAAKKRSAAFTRITRTPRLRANTAITWSPSWWRSRPWSTNTQVSWSPIALCSSAATTEESTPPDSPSSTLPPPTCARTRAMASSMMLPAFQLESQPQMPCRKRS